MKKKNFGYIFLAGAASFIFSYQITLAQTTTPATTTPAATTPVSMPPPPVVAPYSCPSFGKEIVKVTLTGPVGKVLAGTNVPVTLKIENTAGYPLVGGSVLVRVISGKFLDKSLFSVPSTTIERFLPMTDIHLPASGSKTEDFSIALHDKLPSGAYTVIASYVPSTQYNIENPDSDLDQVSGSNSSSLSLNVAATSPKNTALVYFDKKSLSIVDGSEGKVNTSLFLANTSPIVATVPVLWKLYYWDAVSDSTLVKSVVESVQIPANGHVAVAYSFDNSLYSTYEVIGEADSMGLKAFVSFNVDGAKGGSIVRSVGIAPFPTAAGEPSTLFGCVNNTFADDTNPGTLYVSVTDKAGTVLDKSVFAVRPGYQYDFFKQVDLKGAGAVTVSANLIALNSTRSVQLFEATFDCAKLGVKCPEPAPSIPVATGSGNLPYLGIALLAGGIAGVLITRHVLKGSKGRAMVAPSPVSAPVSAPVSRVVPVMSMPTTTPKPMFVPPTPPTPPVQPVPPSPMPPPTTNPS